ncbi:MAG: hemerythrin domain-containing protein [Betaproteobacteria bacterium]|nr:hemerythrin domain-containing protein [Betaproteobacteria bacterium]MCL2885844.1 hemerythrin domain-containing protein [Betaproteobacteria bacterium]
MSFLDFLFGRKRKDTQEQVLEKPEEAPKHAPGTQISYSPDLVPQLHEEHQKLVEIFGMINTAFAKNDLPLTAKFIDEFRRDIQAHLLTENIRFYIYLEHSLEKDSESLYLVHSFRQEMDTIGKAVLAFLSQYKDIGTRPDYALPFGRDLEEVGKILVDRIRREEETLYPLYLPIY